MKSEQLVERIAKRYLVSQGHSQQSASSTDWISVATEIGAALIPIIRDCIAKRRGAGQVAEFAKRRPLLTRIEVRNGLGKEGIRLADRRAAVNAVMDEIEQSNPDELTTAFQEVADDS